ncbi:unnamed protein product [Rhodiola kirilowii]
MEVGCNVVEALINGDREAQMNAAQEMIDMKSKQRQKLVEKGVIHPLILMMRSGDEDVAGLALYALISLAFGSERNKVRIVRSGAVPVLCEMLRCGSLGLIQQAVTGLMILSSCSSNKVTIAASGAVELLIEILDYSSCLISEQAKLDAISTLLNLSTCPNLIPLLVSSGVVMAMVGLLLGSDKASEIVEKATELMEKLVCESSLAVEEVDRVEGATQLLIETVEEGSSQCKEYALGTLLVLCQSCREKYRGMFLREGIIPGLLQVSVDGTWRGREMSRELLEILREGSSTKDCSGVSSSSAGKGELVERIMEEIDSRGEKGLDRTLRLVEKMIAKLKA